VKSLVEGTIGNQWSRPVSEGKCPGQNWGSRGRRFKSGQPDKVERGFLGETPVSLVIIGSLHLHSGLITFRVYCFDSSQRGRPVRLGRPPRVRARRLF